MFEPANTPPTAWIAASKSAASHDEFSMYNLNAPPVSAPRPITVPRADAA